MSSINKDVLSVYFFFGTRYAARCASRSQKLNKNRNKSTWRFANKSNTDRADANSLFQMPRAAWLRPRRKLNLAVNTLTKVVKLAARYSAARHRLRYSTSFFRRSPLRSFIYLFIFFFPLPGRCIETSVHLGDDVMAHPLRKMQRRSYWTTESRSPKASIRPCGTRALTASSFPGDAG